MKTIVLTDAQVELLWDLLADHSEACRHGEREDRSAGNDEDADTAKEQGELTASILALLD